MCTKQVISCTSVQFSESEGVQNQSYLTWFCTPVQISTVQVYRTGHVSPGSVHLYSSVQYSRTEPVMSHLVLYICTVQYSVQNSRTEPVMSHLATVSVPHQMLLRPGLRLGVSDEVEYIIIIIIIIIT